MAYVSPTMRGSRQQAQQGLESYARNRGLSSIDWARMSRDIGDDGADEIGGDLYNRGVDWVNREAESFLERQQRLNAPPQQQPQQRQTAPPRQANPWQQWGMDPLKDQPANQSGSKEQAIAGLRYVAQANGIKIDEKVLNDAANASGYTGSGPVTGEQYNKAKQYILGLKGNQQASTAGPAATSNTQLPAHLQVQMRQPQVTQFGDFSAKASPWDQDIDSIVANLLNEPSMNEQAVNALKARARDTAVAQMAALRGANADRLRAQGFSPDGGTMLSAEALADEQLINDLINKNVDIDLLASDRNRADRMGAVQLAEAIAGGRSGRRIGEFGANLQGQMAQAGLDFDIDRFLAENERANRALQLQEMLGRAGIDLDKLRLDIQQGQFKTATMLDLARFLEGIRQFDVGFGENQRQFNNSSAFNWASLGMNQQNSLLNFLNSLFGR